MRPRLLLDPALQIHSDHFCDKLYRQSTVSVESDKVKKEKQKITKTRVDQLALVDKKSVPFRRRRLRAEPCLYTLETNYYFGPAKNTSFGVTPLKQLTPDPLTSVSFFILK